MTQGLRRFLVGVAAAALLPAGLAAQQPAVITGHVTSASGTPLANAQVTVQQLGIGATSRGDGSYTVLVPAARIPTGPVTVTARLIGYKLGTTQVSLEGGSATADFALADNPLQLGEVVVTGAGTASEVEKLGSVRDNVSGNDLIGSQEASVVNALAAKAPNVTVTASSGDPGSSAFIQIRGPRSYSQTSTPIFVIDGQPLDNTTYATNNFDALDNEGPITGPSTQSRLTDLNPADIESVEILKGPAAANIYGARAANGAILITTKSGKAGPTRYTLRSSFGGDRPTRYEPLQRQWGQGRFGSVPFGAGSNPCAGGGASATCFRSWGPDVSSGTTYDHARELFETGFTSDQTLSISGGNDRTTFYVSGNNVYQNGSVVGSNDILRRTTVRLNGTHQASDRIKVSANASYAKTDGKFIERGNDASGIGIAAFRTPPEFNNLPFLDANGQHRSYLLPNPDPSLDFGQTRVFDNPFFIVNEFQDQSSNQRVFGNVAFDIALTDWLKVNETVGTDYYNDDRLNAFPINASQFPTGKVTAGNITNFTIDHNLTATASYKLSPGLAGTFTVGQNINANRQTLRGTTGRDLITATPFNLQNTVQRDPIIDQEFKTRVVGYFGQATFDIGNQLFLTGAVRYDGSNTFGPDQKYAWFPKASAAWNFLKDRPGAIVSYGKLRASYGEAAVQAQPYLAQTVLVGTSTQAFLNGGVQGVGLESTENGFGGYFTSPTKGAGQLQPERSKEFEAGFDVGLFGDKADASFTWYNAQTSNVILNFPLAPSTGFQIQSQNAGKIRNRGIEVSLNIRPVTSKAFAWDLGFQFARNRNIVLGLGDVPADQFVELPGAFLVSSGLQVGQPFGVLRGAGLIKCGLTPSGTLPDLDAVCTGAQTGALYIGADGFPVLDPNLRIVGDPNPNWTGSGRTSVRFKKLTLSALVDVRNGGAVWNGTKAALYSYGTHLDTQVRADCSGELTGGDCVGNLKTFGKDFWFIGPVVGPGAGLAVPIGENWFRQGPANVFIGNDEDFVEDGGFVRLREVAVQFTVDQPWVRRSLGLSSIDLRLAGRNLLTHTDYTGLDPETNLGQAEQVRRGVDYFNSPQSRSVNFSVTLTR
jgi:TonB-linked SusC/RagA family outer membrane protein